MALNFSNNKFGVSTQSFGVPLIVFLSCIVFSIFVLDRSCGVSSGCLCVCVCARVCKSLLIQMVILNSFSINFLTVCLW